jgi:hypothetical protein
MLAATMSATLSALILFSRPGVRLTFEDVTKALKSALCFDMAAVSSSLAAEIAASMSVCLVGLGDGGLDAIDANVSSSVTIGLSPSMSFLQFRTSRIDRPGWGRDLDAERVRVLERGRVVSTLFVSASSSLMVLRQKISE